MLKFGFADHLSESRYSWMATNLVGAQILLKMWERTTTTICNVPGKYGPRGEFFFFLLVERSLSSSQTRWNSGPAETWKACALIVLHIIAEEATLSSFSGMSLELRGM